MSGPITKGMGPLRRKKAKGLGTTGDIGRRRKTTSNSPAEMRRRNCRQADVCGIDLNERHCAMSVGSLGELYIEFLIPTAVVQYYVRHASSFSGELAHSAISAKSALFVDAKILILRGGNNR